MKTALRKKKLVSAAVDFLTAGIAMGTFSVLRYYFYLAHGFVMPTHPLRYITSGMLLVELAAFPLMMVAIFWLTGYYAEAARSSRLKDLGNAAGCSLAGVLIFFFAALLNDFLPMRMLNYELILIFFGMLTLLVTSGRWILHAVRSRAARRGTYAGRPTLIIGSDSDACAMAERLRQTHKVMGLDVMGLAIPDGETGECSSQLPRYSIDDVPQLVKENKVDAIVFASQRQRPSTLELIRRFISMDVSVLIPPDASTPSVARRSFSNVAGEPLVDLSNPPMNPGVRNLKRIIDVAVSSIALIVLSPLMAAIAIAVKADSPGPVFYRQRRVGYHRRPFDIFKFRSMRVDAEEKSGPALSSADDPRITRVGRILRKYRLDELPNFWNVVKGDMSLVGPRPEREFFLSQIMERAPHSALLLRVRPGITSWGMVKYGYAESVDEMVERLRYDLLYVENMSLAVDLKILFYTIHTVITGKGI